jgi:DNA-directed RNA polymerase subunit RPC12/RpoP
MRRMAVYMCPTCNVMIVDQPASEGRLPRCPGCGLAMVIRPTGAAKEPDKPGEIKFPKQPLRETVLDLELPEQLRLLAEQQKKKKAP